MPITEKFTSAQLQDIENNRWVYIEYCNLKRDAEVDKSKVKECTQKFSPALIKIIQTVYLTDKNTSPESDLFHSLFKDFYLQQLHSIDTFNPEIAKRSLTQLQQQISGMPNSALKELNLASEQISQNIAAAKKQKDKVYAMTCAKREKYINELKTTKENTLALEFAQKIQSDVKSKIKFPDPNLELPALEMNLLAALTAINASTLSVDLSYSVLVEQIRLYKAAIITKILAEVNTTFSLDPKKVIPQLRLITQKTNALAERISNKFQASDAFFIKYFLQQYATFSDFMESTATPILRGPLITTEALNSPKVCERIALLLSKMQTLNAIQEPEQRAIFTDLASQTLIDKIIALVPGPKNKEAAQMLKFPINLDIKLQSAQPLDKEGIMLCDAFSKKVEGKIENFQLPYYISIFSALQLNMTGIGMKKTLSLMFRLQQRFIEGLCRRDLIDYKDANFSDNENYKNFSDAHVQVIANLSGFNPADQKFIIDYRLKLDELINSRIAELRSSLRPN